MDASTVVQLPLDQLIQLLADNGPSTYEIVALIATVILGLLSLAIAYFVFRLSQGFERKAETALDRISVLSTEIRQLVKSGVLDQTQMSNKMLDSIIMGNYGASEGGPIEASKLMKTETLDEVSALIDEKLSSIKTVGQSDLDNLKEEIRAIGAREAPAAGDLVSDALFRRISSFKEYPAFVVLLHAIVKHNATSTAAVASLPEQEGVPSGFDMGIEQLIEKDILLGTPDAFRISQEFGPELRRFLEANSAVISDLRAIKLGEGTRESLEEGQAIAQRLRF